MSEKQEPTVQELACLAMLFLERDRKDERGALREAVCDAYELWLEAGKFLQEGDA